MLKKLTDQHKRWIALGIGIAIVLLGTFQALFHNAFLETYRYYIDKFCYWGFIIAAMLILSIRFKPKNKAQNTEPPKIETEDAATEEKKEN